MNQSLIDKFSEALSFVHSLCNYSTVDDLDFTTPPPALPKKLRTGHAKREKPKPVLQFTPIVKRVKFNISPSPVYEGDCEPNPGYFPAWQYMTECEKLEYLDAEIDQYNFKPDFTDHLP